MSIEYLLNKKIDLVFVIGLLSTLVTLSAQAYVSFFIIVLAMFAKFFFDVFFKFKVSKTTFSINIIFIFIIFSVWLLFGEQIIAYDAAGNRIWDGIWGWGSYGFEQGLIEVMGRQALGLDDVEGWLTARQVTKMWRCRNAAKNR